MRHFLKLAVPVFLLLASGAMADDLTATSRITEATVYADRATLTREAEIEIPAGASTIALENLPSTLFADSLRVEGSAIAGVTLGALDSRIVNSAELVQERARDLQAKVQTLQDQRAMIQADGKANEARRDFLGKLGDTASDRVNDDITLLDLRPEQWTAAGDALANAMQASLRQDALRVVALREIDKQISLAQADLRSGQTGQHSTYTISVPVEAKAATKLTLKLSYQLPGASWRPVYDARLDTKSGKLTLTQFGEVRQNTGEDWKDVALTLSTAQPTRGAELPPLNTQWVDLFDPNAIQASLAANTYDGNAVPSSYAKAVKEANVNRFDTRVPTANNVREPKPTPAPMAARFQEASIDTGGSINEYKIPGKATVMADNSARKVMIGSLDSTSQVVEQVRPALSPNAFLVAKTKIAGDAPLIPGNANLFRDGVYIGNMPLPLVRPGDETTVSFGIDDQVTVKRQVLQDVRGTSGVISKDKTQDRKVTSEIHNLHKTAITLEVLETVPVPRNSDIKVTVLPDDTTKGYEENAKNVTGLEAWQMDLGPDAKTVVKLGWRVSWPDDKQLNGLPQ